MRIEFKDPLRCYGMNDRAVAKVHAALMKMSGIRAIKSGKMPVRDYRENTYISNL